MLRTKVPIFGNKNRIADKRGGITPRVHQRIGRPTAVVPQASTARLFLGRRYDYLGARHSNFTELLKGQIFHFTSRGSASVGRF